MRIRIKRILAALFAAALAVTSGVCLFGCGEQQPQPISKIALTETASDYSEYVNTYGRIFYSSDLGGVTFINSASGFEVRFRGTELVAEVQTLSGGTKYPNGMFSVFVDGETDSNARILKTEASGGLRDKITIVSGLSEGEHTVKVLKRTPSNRDRLIVSEISTDGELLTAPAKPSVDIEFYGDSITCGEGVLREYKDENGNLIDDNSSYYTQETQNVFQSYAGECAKNLGAAFRVFGRGGIALKYRKAGDPYTVSNNYESVAVDLPASDYPYDYNSYRPSVVVVYLGTNDYLLYSKHGSTVVDDDGNRYSSGGLTVAVVNFVKDVIGQKYGYDMPVILCSNLMVPKAGLDKVMTNAAAQLTEFECVRAVRFEKGVTADKGGHPVVEDSIVAGKRLSDEIKSVLGLE